MRNDFEHWARNAIGQPDFSGFHSEGGLWVYHHNIMQLCWRAWRASLSS